MLPGVDRKHGDGDRDQDDRADSQGLPSELVRKFRGAGSPDHDSGSRPATAAVVTETGGEDHQIVMAKM
jgi:hypothetical protein